MNDEKKLETKEEYIFKTNEKQQKIIKTVDKEKDQEINIIFENEEETNVMSDVLKQLTKFYVEDILKAENKKRNNPKCKKINGSII